MLKTLGYLRYQATNLDAWKEFSDTILGCEADMSSDKRQLKLRLDDFSHRICLVEGGSEAVLAYGWEVDSQDVLSLASEAVKREDCFVSWGSREEAHERDVDEFFSFTDPAGHRHEIFYSPHIKHLPPRLTRPIKGYRTGELGLGHVNVVCKDVDKSRAFYEQIMGFKVSDYIRWDDADATFYHCNRRHHSFGFMNECFGQTAPALHHLMMELRDQDDLGRLYDEICAKHPEKLILHLGKHSNDRMMSMYIKTPSVFAIELGWGGCTIDDEQWEVVAYDSTKLWGHHPAG